MLDSRQVFLFRQWIRKLDRSFQCCLMEPSWELREGYRVGQEVSWVFYSLLVNLYVRMERWVFIQGNSMLFLCFIRDLVGAVLIIPVSQSDYQQYKRRRYLEQLRALLQILHCTIKADMNIPDLTDNQDYMPLVALILVLFILMLFSLAVLIVGFTNIKKILQSSIVFYGLLAILMLTKLITELYFAINLIIIVEGKTSEESKERTLSLFEGASKNGMYVTDFVICSMFLILMKQFHTLQYEALLDKDSSIAKKIWTVLQLLEFGGFVAFIALYNFNILNFTETTISTAILNGLPCILYIAINLHGNIAMTGAVTEQEITNRLKRTNKLLFWFFFSRALQAAYEIVLITDIGKTPFVNVILNLEKAKGDPILVLSCFAIYLFVILLTEMVPFILSAQSTTVQLMQPIEVHSPLKESILQSNSSFITLIKKTENEEQIEKEIDLNQFQTVEVLTAGQNGFGVVKKGRMRGRMVVLRTIETELSKYLLEEIASEIQEMKKLQVEGLIPIKYSILQPKFVSFITEHYDTNLRKIIDGKISLNESIRLMYELNNVINELHRMNLPHGTLKVNNIYVLGTHVKVADHGLLSLKKFMSITQGYSNKSIYTAPQLLSGRHSVVVKPTKEGDIYAFGMIMFEVFSGITVYRNLPIHEIESSFKEKQIRPKIPAHLPAQLQNLIRNCWQQDPNQRPSIEEVGIILREYRNKFN